MLACEVYEKKFKCPHCLSSKTQRRGIRKGKEKYSCLSCGKWFQINRLKRQDKAKELTRLHLNGISFRVLAKEYDLSVGKAFNLVTHYLSTLPHCADITRLYCSRFSGILLVDGKYLKVKGYKREIPVIYGIDYNSHDIPSFTLARGESLIACKKYFGSIKLAGYQLLNLVSDDNPNFRDACKYYYPQSTFQLCLNHYQQSVKYTLDLDNKPRHVEFYKSFKTLFAQKYAKDDFQRRAKGILNYFRQDKECVEIMVDCYRKLPLLDGWREGKHIPTTNNLIESFNSHLEARLKALKGFESFHHATLWLNGYFLNRRTKKFTDCRGKFSNLNGFNSLSKTKKPGIDIPIFF